MIYLYANTIGSFDKDDAIENAKVTRSGIIRYFSQNTFNSLMNVCDQISSIRFGIIADWESYHGEEWYSQIQAESVAQGINPFSDRLSKNTGICKRAAAVVFNMEWEVDGDISSKISSKCGELAFELTTLRNLADRVK